MSWEALFRDTLPRMALRNLITDVAGVTVGHADDAKLASGVTAIMFDEPAVASIDVRGGGTGTRESVLLDPSMTVEKIDALVLAGGSAFGLDAAAGVMAQLAEAGPRLRGARRAGADRAGRDPVRPAQRRRQGLGPFPALSRARLHGGRGGRRHIQARHRRRRLRRHHRQSQRRHRFRLGDGRRHHGRRAGRGQCRGLRHRRVRAVVLGGAVRARRRVRRARPALADARRCADVPHQGTDRSRTPRWRWSRPTRP